jgi:hypothetical protein
LPVKPACLSGCGCGRCSFSTSFLTRFFSFWVSYRIDKAKTLALFEKLSLVLIFFDDKLNQWAKGMAVKEKNRKG